MHYLQDDTVAVNSDSLLWAWRQLRTNGARYSEAAILMAESRFAEADSVIQAMPVEREMRPGELNERGRMLKYIDILGGAASNGRNLYQLHSSEVDSLKNMIGDHYDRPAVWASNLLCKVYNKCRAPYTGPSPTPKSMNVRDLTQPEESVRTGSFGLQPNPTRDVVYFQYEHLAEGAKAMIVIRQLNGRPQLSEKLIVQP